MKLSICIPQYNRIKFLVHSLETIEKQFYKDLEIVISDDCSQDNTMETINAIKANYKFPITYFRHSTNQGYDKNLRTSIELAQGEYVITIGNDDTINPDYDLRKLIDFIEKNNYPDVGFTNFIDSGTNQLENRATTSGILGTGPEIAFANYSRFSFVGGIIYKKSTFLQHNTSKFDGSVYTQMYLSSKIIASGGVLFSIADPVIIKDILPQENLRGSYTDRLTRRWRNFKVVNGGLPSVMGVLIASFEDAGVLNEKFTYGIFRKMFGTTLPYWILNYRKNKALPEAVGLAIGMRPGLIKEYRKLQWSNRFKVNVLYLVASVSALLVPVSLFERYKAKLWKMANNIKD